VTTHRRSSSPRTSVDHPDEPGRGQPGGDGDEHPTEVFHPVWDAEQDGGEDEPAGYPDVEARWEADNDWAVANRWDGVAEEPDEVERPTAGQPAQRVDRDESEEYPTQVIAAFRDDPAEEPARDHPDAADYPEPGSYPDYRYAQPQDGYHPPDDYAQPDDYDSRDGYDQPNGYDPSDGYHQPGAHDQSDGHDQSEERAEAKPGERPMSLAEQLFGTYESATEDYQDTAIIARITEHGAIVEHGVEHVPVVAARPKAIPVGPARRRAGSTAQPADPEPDPEPNDLFTPTIPPDAHDDEAHTEIMAVQPPEDPDEAHTELIAAAVVTDDAETPGETTREAADAATTRQTIRETTQEAPDVVGEEPAVLPTRAMPTRAADATRAEPADTPEPQLLAGYGGVDEALPEEPVEPAVGRGPSWEDLAETRDEYGAELVTARPGKAWAGGGASTRASADGPTPLLVALALLLVTVLAAGTAGFAWTKARQAARPTESGNIAFLDTAATAQVKDQVSKAIEAIYSYDSTQLDQSESRALAVVTDDYAEEFKQNFATVRQLAPKERASLTSTVVEVGVESLTPTRATLLLMVNQVGHRGDNPQPLRAAVRLNVTAEKVDGQWKVAGVSQK
jgi:Mce-associated membrane protein